MGPTQSPIFLQPEYSNLLDEKHFIGSKKNENKTKARRECIQTKLRMVERTIHLCISFTNHHVSVHPIT